MSGDATERWLTSWCAILLAAVAGVWLWAWQEGQGRRGEAEALRQQATAHAATIASGRQRLRELIVMQDAADEVAPAEAAGDVATTLAAIERAAIELSIACDIAEEPAEALGEYRVQRISVQAVGASADVLEWVRQAEQITPAMQITRLELMTSGASTTSDALEIEAGVDFRVYAPGEAAPRPRKKLSDGGAAR